MTPQETFLYWIKERESVREKKDAGLPKPWSQDSIFQTYKFCNVRREDDRVSRWLFEHWMQPNRGHKNMWFAMVVARLFNWPPTLEQLGFPKLQYTDLKEQWRKELKRIREGGKVFTGAYLVSTNGVQMDKVDYILDRVLMPIWERGRAPVQEDTLESYWSHLREFDGLGSFMAGQVVADLKFVDYHLENAEDWNSWAPLGPGSTRGLNRIYGRPLEKKISQKQGLDEMRELQQLVSKELGVLLPLHNLQNCLCETDKYLRVTNGEGRPRSTYPGV